MILERNSLENARFYKIQNYNTNFPLKVWMGFLGGSSGKESACSVGDVSSIPGLGRSPGEGKG